MTELKTLKDLDGINSEGDFMFARESPRFIRVSYLREEAIKWIKDPESQTTDSTDEWIKYFFNITEEDLQ